MVDRMSSKVSRKVREAIKAKLVELNAYVDDELPDYIMVMVANQKSAEVMKADLGLFLNEHTEVFVEWLVKVLDRLKAVTTSSEAGSSAGKKAKVKIKVKSTKKVKKAATEAPAVEEYDPEAEAKRVKIEKARRRSSPSPVRPRAPPPPRISRPSPGRRRRSSRSRSRSPRPSTSRRREHTPDPQNRRKEPERARRRRTDEGYDPEADRRWRRHDDGHDPERIRREPAAYDPEKLLKGAVRASEVKVAGKSGSGASGKLVLKAVKDADRSIARKRIRTKDDGDEADDLESVRRKRAELSKAMKAGKLDTKKIEQINKDLAGKKKEKEREKEKEKEKKKKRKSDEKKRKSSPVTKKKAKRSRSLTTMHEEDEERLLNAAAVEAAVASAASASSSLHKSDLRHKLGSIKQERSLRLEELKKSGLRVEIPNNPNVTKAVHEDKGEEKVKSPPKRLKRKIKTPSPPPPQPPTPPPATRTTRTTARAPSRLSTPTLSFSSGESSDSGDDDDDRDLEEMRRRALESMNRKKIIIPLDRRESESEEEENNPDEKTKFIVTLDGIDKSYFKHHPKAESSSSPSTTNAKSVEKPKQSLSSTNPDKKSVSGVKSAAATITKPHAKVAPLPPSPSTFKRKPITAPDSSPPKSKAKMVSTKKPAAGSGPATKFVNPPSFTTSSREKCRYWPNCTRGKKCFYFHPDSPSQTSSSSPSGSLNGNQFKWTSASIKP